MQDADRDESLLAEEPWRAPLESLERKLSELRRAVSALRDTLEESDAGAPPLHVVRRDAPADGEPQRPTDIPLAASSELWGAEIGAGASKESFTSVWERIKKEADLENEADPNEEEETPDSRTSEPVADVAEVAEDAETAEIEQEQLADDDPANAKFNEVWERIQRERGADAGSEVGNDAPTAETGERPKAKNLKEVWEKLQQDREQAGSDPLEQLAKGTGLPLEYRMTIEDFDGTPVDLVQINRALRAFAPADDVELLSHANGGAVISMRTTKELDHDELATTIGLATSRSCEVIPQDHGKLFLRLSADEDEGRDG